MSNSGCESGTTGPWIGYSCWSSVVDMDLDGHVHKGVFGRTPITIQERLHHRRWNLVAGCILCPNVLMDSIHRKWHPTDHHCGNRQSMVFPSSRRSSSNIPTSRYGGAQSRMHHGDWHYMSIDPADTPRPSPSDPFTTTDRQPYQHVRLHIHADIHHLTHEPTHPHPRRNPFSITKHIRQGSQSTHVLSLVDTNNHPATLHHSPPFPSDLLPTRETSPPRNSIHHVTHPRLWRMGQHRSQFSYQERR